MMPMGAVGPIRVFLVDDHDIVRLGVRSLLRAERDIEVVGEARTAAQAVEGILETKPDVCLLDLNLPDGSGVDVCRRVTEANPAVRSIMLTGYDDPDAVSAAIMAGAAGFVLKGIEGTSLVAGVRLVASGHTLFHPGVATRVVQQVQFQRRAFDVLADLTPQQSRILFLIADGLTNRQIAERLSVAEKTVKNHVTGLLARLGVEHRTQAALVATKLRSGDVPPPRWEAPALTS